MSKSRNKSLHSPALCPCKSGLALLQCCKPIIKNHSLAKTPEALMRSRYTAYVLQDSSHLFRTWKPEFRPDSLSFDDRKWVNLNITNSTVTGEYGCEGTVTFRAEFIQDDTLVTMEETSSFTKDMEKWYYKDGDCKIHQEQISLNSRCPCNSGKKFKRCCRG